MSLLVLSEKVWAKTFLAATPVPRGYVKVFYFYVPIGASRKSMGKNIISGCVRYFYPNIQLSISFISRKSPIIA